ncbi:hypothetical protein [Escherichia coli]|uniref:hypothetical protein n=1 Tax=Escherichia coli TaxID=562 RepID=UPI0020770623|nr:hypothetical protein [Escherichia coli]
MKGILYSVNSILGIFSLVVFCVLVLESSKFNITTIISPLIVLLLVYIIKFFMEARLRATIKKNIKKIVFSENSISIVNYPEWSGVFVDPIKGEFLIIKNNKFGKPFIKGYNFQQWGGYDYNQNKDITLKFNDFEFPAFSIAATTHIEAKNFCNKLDIMCSPSYSPKDERSFYKHVQQSLATA